MASAWPSSVFGSRIREKTSGKHIEFAACGLCLQDRNLIMILSDELRRHHARIIKDDADAHRCMLFLRMFVSLLITSLVPILSLAKRALIRLGQALPTTMMPSMPPGPSLESACERACVCIAILMARTCMWRGCGVHIKPASHVRFTCEHGRVADLSQREA